MASYVENNLLSNEKIQTTVERSIVALAWTWIICSLHFWLIYPLFKAVWATIIIMRQELAFTDKRLLGRIGVFNTTAVDLALDKVDSIKVDQGFWGKIFKYGTVTVSSVTSGWKFMYVKNPDQFKAAFMQAKDVAEQNKARLQAEEMAKAMAMAMNKNA